MTRQRDHFNDHRLSDAEAKRKTHGLLDLRCFPGVWTLDFDPHVRVEYEGLAWNFRLKRLEPLFRVFDDQNQFRSHYFACAFTLLKEGELVGRPCSGCGSDRSLFGEALKTVRSTEGKVLGMVGRCCEVEAAQASDSLAGKHISTVCSQDQPKPRRTPDIKVLNPLREELLIV